MTPAQARKRQERLRVNIQRVIDVGGMNHAFVGTFTTRANLSISDFQSIWNSFVTDVLVRHLGEIGDDWKPHFHGIGVIEPQERGAPHMHLAGRVQEDIGTGVKWIQRRWGGRVQGVIARQSKPAALARLQAFLMRSWDAQVRSKTGQTEEKICNAHCLPVRSCARAAAQYLAGYLEKGETRPGEWKGRKLYREYGASRVKNTQGETVVNSPHPCHGSFTRFAVMTKDGYKVREHGLMWRARVAAFANEFGCSTLRDLITHLGQSALYVHRDAIGRMVLPDCFRYRSEKLRLWEKARRSISPTSNRELIEASGLSVTRYRVAIPVVVFSTTPNENFWSGAPDPDWDGRPDDKRVGELFPDRIAVITSGEAAVRREARSRRA